MDASKHFAFDVFLSYSKRDRLRVLPLAERLKAAGLMVWLDEWAIKPGDNIYLAIEGGITQARKLVFCLSPAAVKSGWARLEISTAIHRDPSNAKRRFIPLLLVDCKVPEPLKAFKFVDFRQKDEDAFAELFAALECTTASFDSIKHGSALDDFQRSLSQELRRALDEHLAATKRVFGKVQRTC